MGNLDKQTRKREEMLLEIEKIENEFLNDPNIPEDVKKDWVESKNKIKEKFKLEEEQYQKFLEENKHKKIIGYNPENFTPIFEDEQPR
jgi:hypothetical protein